MSASRRWAISVLLSTAFNLAALCLLGQFWRTPPPVRARAAAPSRFAVYTPPPPAPKPPPTPVETPPEPYDITTQPPVVPMAPTLPPTPLSAFSSMPLPLAPMPVTAPTPLAPAPGTSAPAPEPAVAAPSVTPATPSVTPERPMLTTQRPDAPELAPNSTEPSSDSLTEPTLAPASGEGAEPGTTNGTKKDGTGDGSSDKGDGRGKSGTGETGDGGGKRGGGDGRGPFGIKTGGGGNAPRRVVYLLDVSLSMRSRIGRARAELHAALTNLQNGDSFDIIAFSGRVQTFDSALVPVNDAAIAQADYYLTTLSLKTGTDLEKGLTRALSVPDVNTVIVLTDGVPTEGETDTKKLAQRVKEQNRNGAKIYAIGLVGKDPNGDDNTFEATQLLYEITEQNGGDLHTYTVGVQTP